jgi:hypothetical protein
MINRSTCIVLAVAGLLCAPGSASAQDAPNVPSLKTIGVPASTKPQVVPSLFVLNSRGVSLKDGKLMLTGVAPNSIVFADRPVRAAGHELTAHIVEEWGAGEDSFAKNPPNATVSGFSKTGSDVRDAVVVLKSPILQGDTLTFEVVVLEGDLTGADGAAAVFIDIIGRPLTPLSFAGAARRSFRRGAYYRGAAWAGAAAAGAAAAAYYHPYYRPACGRYPYPPCY